MWACLIPTPSALTEQRFDQLLMPPYRLLIVWRLNVIVRGAYDTTIVSPRIAERSEATAQISKIRDARVGSEADDRELGRCVGLDWLSVDPRNVVAAYVVDEADALGLSQPTSPNVTASPPSASSGEPFV